MFQGTIVNADAPPSLHRDSRKSLSSMGEYFILISWKKKSFEIADSGSQKNMSFTLQLGWYAAQVSTLPVSNTAV